MSDDNKRRVVLEENLRRSQSMVVAMRSSQWAPAPRPHRCLSEWQQSSYGMGCRVCGRAFSAAEVQQVSDENPF